MTKKQTWWWFAFAAVVLWVIPGLSYLQNPEAMQRTMALLWLCNFFVAEAGLAIIIMTRPWPYAQRWRLCVAAVFIGFGLFQLWQPDLPHPMPLTTEHLVLNGTGIALGLVQLALWARDRQRVTRQ